MMTLTWGWEIRRRGVGRLLFLPEPAPSIRTIFVVAEATVVLRLSIIIILSIIILIRVIISIIDITDYYHCLQNFCSPDLLISCTKLGFKYSKRLNNCLILLNNFITK